MKVFRTIAAIVVGIIVSMVTITVVHQISGMIYPLPEGTDPNDMEALKRILPTMPLGAFLMVLLAWESGAFVGGAVAALIAAFARVIHAAIIGAWVLIGTIAIMFMLPHPGWMIAAGLVLPVPVAMLAGKLVSLCLPAASSSAAVSS
jgi:hypothetical protein